MDDCDIVDGVGDMHPRMVGRQANAVFFRNDRGCAGSLGALLETETGGAWHGGELTHQELRSTRSQGQIEGLGRGLGRALITGVCFCSLPERHSGSATTASRKTARWRPVEDETGLSL